MIVIVKDIVGAIIVEVEVRVLANIIVRSEGPSIHSLSPRSIHISQHQCWC